MQTRVSLQSHPEGNRNGPGRKKWERITIWSDFYEKRGDEAKKNRAENINKNMNEETSRKKGERE